MIAMDQSQVQGAALPHPLDGVRVLDFNRVRVEHPELGRSFTYPGFAGIYTQTPWQISRRAPMVGEHNTEVFCEEVGLSPQELVILGENGQCRLASIAGA